MILRAVLFAAVVSASSQAQVEFDPRAGLDPRGTDDPRLGEDPRDAAHDPREAPPELHLHVDTLLDEGQDARLARDLGEATWRVQPVVSQLVEQWIGSVDRPDGGEPPPGEVVKAAELRARGRHLAELADASLRDTRFVFWVDTIHAWGPAEFELLREANEQRKLGDAAVRGALFPGDDLAALTPYTRALELYRRLGDTLGAAEVHAAIGDVHAENARVAEAVDHLQRAEQLGHELKALGAVRPALTSLERLHRRRGDWASQAVVLRRQHALALERGEDEDELRRLQLATVEAEAKAAGMNPVIVTPQRPVDGL